MSQISDPTRHLTGTQLNYLLVCPRKLWLFSHGIELERENEAVQLGRQIGREAFSREKKEIKLDDQIVLDWAEHKVGDDGVLTIHEVKKSRAVSQAHRLQMLFYLHILRTKGVTARGLIDYPEIKQRETIELDTTGESELQAALLQAETIIVSEQPPPRLESLRFCSKCAYFDFCWS